MRMSEEQLADYRDRIAWHGEARSDRATLEELVKLHTRTIAFENIDRFSDTLIDLSLDAVVAKLVRGKRGGVCYEQAGLFRDVLETVGFKVSGLMARVKWNVPEGRVNGRTHMALQVDLAEGPVIVDVGFGGQTLTGVLDLVADVEQPTPHGSLPAGPRSGSLATGSAGAREMATDLCLRPSAAVADRL